MDFALGVHTLGIVHAPGFPLYLLAAKAASSLFAFGTILWNIHFASLLFTAGAGVVFYWCGRKLHYPPVVCFSASLLLMFSPFFWQSSLTAAPHAWHLLMIACMLFASIDLLALQAGSFPRLELALWSLLCGAASGQHLSLMPWAVSAWLLGLSVGWIRHQGKPAYFSLAVLAAGAGFLLPYLYLPWRVSALQAFCNPDYLFQYASLRPPGPRSLSTLVPWLAWYLSGGFQPLWQSMGLGGVWQAGESLLRFARSLSLLHLLLGSAGFLASLHRMVLQPAERKNELNYVGRVRFSLIPALAAAAVLLLFPRNPDGLHFTLSLALAIWSWNGLEYCYYRLGHAGQETEKAGAGLHPAWFGIATVLAVPLLAMVHGHAWVSRGRSAGERDSLYRETKAFMLKLPPQTVIVFGRADTSFPFWYLQKLKGVRQDLVLAPVSRLWPWKTWTGPMIPAFRPAATLYWHRKLYHDYWMEGLHDHLRSGRPTVLLLPLGPSDLTQADVLEQMELADVGMPWPSDAAWQELPLLETAEKAGRRLSLPTYRIRFRGPSPAPERPAAWEKTIIDYQSRLRLLALEESQKLVVLRSRFNLLPLKLRWQALRKLQGDYRLHLRLTPALGTDTRPLWETEVRLAGNRNLAEIKPPSAWTQDYLLPVSREFPAGHYLLTVAVTDDAGSFLAAEDAAGKQTFYSPACEMWVVDSGSTTGLKNVP